MTKKGKYWTRIIDEQEASGLSPKDYAIEHKLNVRRLWDWRSRLGRTKTKKRPAKPGAFVEVELIQSPISGEVYLNLTDFKVTAVINHQTDMALLKKTLEALC